MLGVAALVVIMLGFVLSQRFGHPPAAKSPAGGPGAGVAAESTTTAPSASSTPAQEPGSAASPTREPATTTEPPRANGSASAAPAAPATRTTTKPAVAAAHPPARRAPAPHVVAVRTAGATLPKTGPAHASAAKPPGASSEVFGIAVGSYLDEERARLESNKIEAAIGIGARMRQVTVDSTSRYEVVVGAFDNKAAAERTASDLINRGLVEEARVVSEPRAGTPR